MPWFEGGRPVLITGGRGFLGSHLALRLCAMAPEGAEVVAVDDHTRDCFGALGVQPPPNLRFVTGDVRRPHEWLDEVGSPSVVVHCAALAGVSTYYRIPASVVRVNGLGTAALLDALLDRDRPALFVNLSTSEVYGRDAAGVSEDDPTPVGPVADPRWTYAASKVFAEHLVLATAKEGAIDAVSLRPFNVYGPGQVGEGAVRIFAERALRGEPLKVTGDGAQTRAWLYVDDFVEAVLAVVATPDSWGRTFNVGDPETLVTTRDLAERIDRIAGRGAGVELIPHQGQDVMERWPRTDAIRGATGWAPQVGLDEGLRRTVAFWREVVER
jgi:UDP-glucose 4-epimerase